MAPEQFAGVADARTTSTPPACHLRRPHGPPLGEDGCERRAIGRECVFVARVLAAPRAGPEKRWPMFASFRRRLCYRRLAYQRNAIGIAIGCTLLGLGIRASMPAPSTLRFTSKPQRRRRSGGGAFGFGRLRPCPEPRSYPELSAHCVSDSVAGGGRAHIAVERRRRGPAAHPTARPPRRHDRDRRLHGSEWRYLAETWPTEYSGRTEVD